MKMKLYPLALAVIASFSLTACNADGNAVKVTESSTEAEKVGYSLGYMMAEGNKEAVADLNLDTFSQGFRDSYEDKDGALTKEQMEKVLKDYQEKRIEELRKEAEEKAAANEKAGKEYLAANKDKEGVKTTKSGLQYKVIEAGEGESPKATDIVRVNYEGKLIDGTIFDSSYERGEPVAFPLNQVIPGWTEGVQMMKKGGKYEFTIPAELAYGEAAQPGIEPNSTLLFTVELLDFKSPQPVKPAKPTKEAKPSD